MLTVSFQACNRNINEALIAFEKANLLESFHTTLAFSEEAMNLWPGRIRQQLMRRRFSCSLDKIVPHPFPESFRLIADRLRLYDLVRPDAPLGNNAVSASLDRAVASYLHKYSSKMNGVYCFEDASLKSFERAGELGKYRIYELTTPYWRKVLEVVRDEVQRYPEWKETIGSIDTPEQTQERKTKEAEYADRILCISNFVRDSLPIEMRSKARVVQYGFPSPLPQSVPRAGTHSSMRVLFVGYMSQRKGLADVFAAFKLLKRRDVQLVTLGALLKPMDFYRSQFPDFEHHNPVPQNEVVQFMKTCDVLVFPAICEGRGLVQLEAMSCGLPVIGTVNATTDDIVEDGVDGFVVPIRSPEHIAEKLNWLADHPEERGIMGRNALKKASTISWNNYHQQLIDAVLEFESRYA